jgi:putative membrane protein
MKRFSMIAMLSVVSLTLMGSAAPRPARTPADDAGLIARFEEMVSADVSCAQLAVERAKGTDVKNFATILVREHGMARQMARDVATQIGARWKPNPDNAQAAEHEKMLKELRGRNDIAFDVLFIRHEVEYHRDLVNLINKDWMPSAQNPDLQAFFGQVGPAIEAHAKMAEAMQQQMGPKR